MDKFSNRVHIEVSTVMAGYFVLQLFSREESPLRTVIYALQISAFVSLTQFSPFTSGQAAVYTTFLGYGLDW